MGHFGVYSNCQGKYIYKEFLSKMSYFSEWKFTFLENFSMIKDKTTLDENLIGDFDIILYQPVDKKHGVYSTTEDGILSFLKPSCHRISFPSVFADIWPIYEEGGYYGGEPILKLKETKTLEEILDLFDQGKIDFQLKERSAMSLEYMRMREESCTIKSISSFIKDNIQQSRLFYTQNHPTEDFFGFIAGEICDYLENLLDITLRDDIAYGESFMYINGFIEDTSYSFKELGLEYMADYDDSDQKLYITNIYNDPSLALSRSIYKSNPSIL